MSSMLSRFRKPGGFLQLLALIESCESQKRKHLLGLIAAEDPGWAHLVKVKTLTLERILSWPADILSLIFPLLQDSEIVALLQGQNPDIIEKCTGALVHRHKKEILRLLVELRPTPVERSATSLRLYQVIRELETRGQIQFRQFDASLEIDLSIAS